MLSSFIILWWKNIFIYIYFSDFDFLSWCRRIDLGYFIKTWIRVALALATLILLMQNLKNINSMDPDTVLVVDSSLIEKRYGCIEVVYVRNIFCSNSKIVCLLIFFLFWLQVVVIDLFKDCTFLLYICLPLLFNILFPVQDNFLKK